MSKSDKEFVNEVIEHLILEKAGALPDHGHTKNMKEIKKVKNPKVKHHAKVHGNKQDGRGGLVFFWLSLALLQFFLVYFRVLS